MRVPTFRCRPWGLVAAAACLVLVLATTAVADEPVTVTPPPEVVELNEAGVNHVVIGELDKAIETFEASLEVQELNITWMNLGRALQHAGRCEESRDAYANALKAPRVPQPSHQDVVAKIFEYRQELDESCDQDDGTETADAGTSSDDDDSGASGDDPSTTAGDTGEISDDATTDAGDSGDDGADETASLDTRDDTSDPTGDQIDDGDGGSATGPPSVDTPSQPGPSYAPWSYVLLGVGVAALGSMIAIDQAALGPKFDDLDAARSEPDKFADIEGEIETLQATNIALLSVGGAAVVTGTVLLVLDLTADTPRDASADTTRHEPVVFVDEHGATLGWQGRW